MAAIPVLLFGFGPPDAAAAADLHHALVEHGVDLPVNDQDRLIT